MKIPRQNFDRSSLGKRIFKILTEKINSEVFEWFPQGQIDTL